MQYTKLENKLIAIRKMLPKVVNADFGKMLERNRVIIKKRQIESKPYFFK